MRTLLTPILRLFRTIRVIFRGGAQQGLWGRQIIALPVCWFSCTQLSICQQEEIDHLSLKEGFFCSGNKRNKFTDVSSATEPVAG